MINMLILFSIIVIIGSCTVSPRYTANPEENKIKKTKYSKSKTSVSSNKNVYKGISSWYGPNFHGKQTANGEIFDQYGITAAHKTLPLGTVVRVTNLDNGEWTILRINDKSFFLNFINPNRTISLSRFIILF